jgi:hypothetical protein
MSRLHRYKKSSREDLHQYPWKSEVEDFVLFSSYCDSLNLSVNEGLNLLVRDEILSYRKDMPSEELSRLKEEFKSKSKKVSNKK